MTPFHCIRAHKSSSELWFHLCGDQPPHPQFFAQFLGWHLLAQNVHMKARGLFWGNLSYSISALCDLCVSGSHAPDVKTLSSSAMLRRWILGHRFHPTRHLRLVLCLLHLGTPRPACICPTASFICSFQASNLEKQHT